MTIVTVPNTIPNYVNIRLYIVSEIDTVYVERNNGYSALYKFIVIELFTTARWDFPSVKSTYYHSKDKSHELFVTNSQVERNPEVRLLEEKNMKVCRLSFRPHWQRMIISILFPHFKLSKKSQIYYVGSDLV